MPITAFLFINIFILAFNNFQLKPIPGKWGCLKICQIFKYVNFISKNLKNKNLENTNCQGYLNWWELVVTSKTLDN